MSLFELFVASHQHDTTFTLTYQGQTLGNISQEQEPFVVISTQYSILLSVLAVFDTWHTDKGTAKCRHISQSSSVVLAYFDTRRCGFFFTLHLRLIVPTGMS